MATDIPWTNPKNWRKKPLTGTIDNASKKQQAEKAEREATRRASDQRVTSRVDPRAPTKPVSPIGNWFDDTARNEQNLRNLEQQLRYSNSGTAHGINPSVPTPNTALASGTPRYGGSGGGGYGGGGTPVEETPELTLEQQMANIANMSGVIDPSLARLVPNAGEIELMYKRLTDDFAKQQNLLNQDYASAIGNVQGNYDQSQNFIRQAISGDQATLAQAAQNMGVNNWDSGPTAVGLTEALNRLIGTSSQNEATDLAWFEKMKNLDTDQFGNFNNLAGFYKQSALEDSQQNMLELQEQANQVAQNQAMAALMAELDAASGGSGGGGGGRGGYGRGGGSSSNKGSYSSIVENATETGELDFAGLTDAIAGLPPEQQREAIEYWVRGGGTGTGAARLVLSEMDKLNKGSAGLMSRIRGSGGSSDLEYLFQLYTGYVPGLAPIFTQQTKDASERRSRVYDDEQYVPPPFQLTPAAPVNPQRPRPRLNLPKPGNAAKPKPKSGTVGKTAKPKKNMDAPLKRAGRF